MQQGRIWVVGSANMDLVVPTERHPAPGETLLGEDLALHPGGKGANQAIAAARMGAAVTMVAAVGSDPYGDRLVATLAGEGIDVGPVARSDRPTGTAMIVVAGGQNTIVVSAGANSTLGHEHLRTLTPSKNDVVVVQLEIPVATARAAIATGREAGATTILNAAPVVAGAKDLKADVVVINATELAALSGRDISDDDPTQVIIAAMEPLGARVVTTLGARGCIALDRGRLIEVPAPAVAVTDPTGAGDCFVGVLAAELLGGSDLVAGLWVATAAAGLSVGRAGAASSMPTRAEVEGVLD